MANQGELRIYLTHEKMILTNDQGVRMEFNIPIPGNITVVHVGPQAFHVGLYPPDPPTSPTISEHESDDSSSLSSVPNGGGGPGDPIEI